MKDATPTLLLSMSAPPYWHCGRTVLKRSIDQLVALLPAAAMAVVNWGLPALRVMCLAMAVCVAVEAICCWAMDRKSTIDDFTAVVAGLLYSFMLPAGAPWWIVVVGAVSAMLFGKMLFGGHGNNPETLVSGVVQVDWLVRKAIDFAIERGDTLVLVTADHETGGVQAVAGNGGATPETIHFSSFGHTGAHVPLYAFGPGAERFTGVMDNTDVAKTIAFLLGLSFPDQR